LVSTAVAALALAGISPSAFAADLPVKQPVHKAPPYLPPVYDWTGFYIGGHGGYAWTSKDWRLPSGVELVSYTADGFIGGVQGGYNWQFGAWVFGVEAQASWGEIRKGVPYIEQDNIIGPAGLVTRARVGTTVENLGTVALRIGRAWDRSLVYVKGGAAWAYDVYRAFDLGVPGAPLLASGSDTRWGAMVGIGYEYAFLGNWSAKIEYGYLGFGNKRITLVSVPGVTPTTRQFDVRQDISLIKLGINYRFGGPVYARY
jgi:outer membrane immunogenic protein